MTQDTPQTVETAHAAMNELLTEHIAKPKPNALPKIRPLNISHGANALDDIKALTAFMDVQEVNMDLRCGIVRATIRDSLAHIGAKQGQKSDVIIRDARAQTDNSIKPEDTEESWIIAAAARTRGALKLISTVSGSVDDVKAAQENTWKIFNGYNERLQKANNPKARQSLIQNMDYELTWMLKHSGLKMDGMPFSTFSQKKDLSKMLLDARDACNFERENHPSIVTITGDLTPNNDKRLSQIITSIPTTPCADRNDYFGKTMEDQAWYKNLSESNKPVDRMRLRLTERYKGFIADGKHVTPTQLRWLPGTANTYVQKVSYLENDNIIDEKSGFTTLRTAAPVHGRGKEGDETITKANIEHLQSILNNKTYIQTTATEGQNNNKQPCTFVGLNSDTGKVAGLIGQGEEQKITDEMKQAAGKNFISAAISVAWSKTKNLARATDAILKGSAIVFCKSGKDRTQAVLSEAGFANAATHINPTQHAQAFQTIARAGHGEIMAGANGSSRGGFGTKIANVFGGKIFLRLKDGLILNAKKFVTNKINRNTGIHPVLPTNPVLVEIKAVTIGTRIKALKSAVTHQIGKHLFGLEGKGR